MSTNSFHSSAGQHRQQQKQYPQPRQGIATVPQVPSTFDGRGGLWACENCGETLLLPDRTQQWTCARCIRVMHTYPESECPLERVRRFIVQQTTNTNHHPK